MHASQVLLALGALAATATPVFAYPAVNLLSRQDQILARDLIIDMLAREIVHQQPAQPAHPAAAMTEHKDVHMVNPPMRPAANNKGKQPAPAIHEDKGQHGQVVSLLGHPKSQQQMRPQAGHMINMNGSKHGGAKGGQKHVGMHGHNQHGDMHHGGMHHGGMGMHHGGGKHGQHKGGMGGQHKGGMGGQHKGGMEGHHKSGKHGHHKAGKHNQHMGNQHGHQENMGSQHGHQEHNEKHIVIQKPKPMSAPLTGHKMGPKASHQKAMRALLELSRRSLYDLD